MTAAQNKGIFHIFQVPWAAAMYYVEQNSGSSCACLLRYRLILGTAGINFLCAGTPHV